MILLGLQKQRDEGVMRFRPATESEIEEAVATIAATGEDVFLTGPTGSGKSFTASRIHELSSRHGQKLVTADCTKIPANLAEVELFGSVRGAFTGAEKKLGLLGQAHKGTLFLDEIGELPLEVQSKLFLVLDTRRYRKMGSGQEEPADFRLISATNKDLVRACREGRFRPELYYRINILPLELPPLRSRKAALADFVAMTMRDAVGKDDARIERIRHMVERLSTYPGAWPGGFREVRSFVLRCALGDPDDVEHLLVADWRDMAGQQQGPLTRIPRAASPPIDDKARYAGLIQRCVLSGSAPGARPLTAGSREVALRLASRLLDLSGATLSRAELRESLGVTDAKTVDANLRRLLAHGLVREQGADVLACWPPCESSLLVLRGGDWVPILAEGPAYAVSGERLRIEARSKLSASLGVMLITHTPGRPFSSSVIGEPRRAIAGEVTTFELVLDANRGFEQILVHLAPAQTLGGAPVDSISTEPIVPSAEELEEGRRLVLTRFGEGWLGEHLLYHGGPPG